MAEEKSPTRRAGESIDFQPDDILIVECTVTLQRRGRNVTQGTVVISGEVATFDYELTELQQGLLRRVIREVVTDNLSHPSRDGLKL
jgi:hypothetical protein